MTDTVADLLEPRRRWFDLKVEPWIPVAEVATGYAHDVSLSEALQRADELQLAPADPVLHQALLRYLVALTYLAHLEQPDGPWERCATDGAPLPVTGVAAALERVAEHTWLEHPDTPFLQLAELAELMPAKKATRAVSAIETSTVPFETVYPNAATGNNPEWFSRALSNSRPAPAQAARGLLLRHYFGLPGLEPANARVGASKFFSIGGGALTAFAPDRGRTYIAHEGANLAQTLVANLARDITHELDRHATPFWEAPGDSARKIEDPLWLYTATGTASLLIPVNGSYRLLRSAGLYTSKSQGEALKRTLAKADPHTLRVDPRSAKAESDYSHLVLNPDDHQLANVRIFHAWTADEGLQDPCLIGRRGQAYPSRRTTSLRTLDVSGAGNAAGPSLTAATARHLDPSLYLLEGRRARALQTALDRVGASKGSARSKIVYHVCAALGSDAFRERVRRETDLLLWDRLEPVLTDLVQAIQDEEPPPRDLTDAQRRELVDAGLDVYQQLTRPYAKHPRRRADIADHRASLRRSLWTL